MFMFAIEKQFEFSYWSFDFQAWSVVATMRHPPVEIVEKMLAGVMEIVNGVGENVNQKVCN